MPSPYVKKLASETGKSEAEIERLWNKAKDITADTFGKKEDDFGTREYKYTVGIVKNMLGVNESLLDPAIFLKSGKSARDFIRETVTSSGFSISDNNPVTVSKSANDGEADAEKQTFSDFPGTDSEDLSEHREVPQGSADVGEFMTDLSSDVREKEADSPTVGPENPDDLRSIEDDEVVLPPDEYYDAFYAEEDDPFAVR